MNKTLTTLGVGIWGVSIILNFILQSSLRALGLTCQQINDTLIPLFILELIAFILTIIGLLKDN